MFEIASRGRHRACLHLREYGAKSEYVIFISAKSLRAASTTVVPINIRIERIFGYVLSLLLTN